MIIYYHGDYILSVYIYLYYPYMNIMVDYILGNVIFHYLSTQTNQLMIFGLSFSDGNLHEDFGTPKNQIIDDHVTVLVLRPIPKPPQ